MGKRTSADPPELWERQPGEGPQAFNAFAAYRDSGIDGKRRSLQKTAESLTKRDGSNYSVGTLKEWSRKHNWQMRVDAFDQEMDRQVQEELIKGKTAMLKNHIGIAKAMLTKALKGLQRMPDDELTPQDVARFVDTGSKLERISRGETTERTDGKQTIAGDVRTDTVLQLQNFDFSGLTDEELEQLGKLVTKLASD